MNCETELQFPGTAQDKRTQVVMVGRHEGYGCFLLARKPERGTAPAGQEDELLSRFGLYLYKEEMKEIAETLRIIARREGVSSGEIIIADGDQPKYFRVETGLDDADPFAEISIGYTGAANNAPIGMPGGQRVIVKKADLRDIADAIAVAAARVERKQP